MRRIVAGGLLAAVVGMATVIGAAGGLERLYVLDCGLNIGKDQSRWSPGVNEGKPIEFSDNCYLIRHAKGLLLWVWINHDRAQSAQLRYAPGYYE